MVTFPDFHSHSPALLDLFISFYASICSTMAFPPLWISDHVVVSFSIDFPSNSQRGCPVSLHTLWLFLCWLERSSRSFERCSIGRYLLNWVLLLLLLVSFVCGLRLGLMYISLIISIRSSLTHLHGFQLLVLVFFLEGVYSLFWQIAWFFCHHS